MTVRSEAGAPAGPAVVTGRRRRWFVVVAPVVAVLALWGLSTVGRAIVLSAPGELPWTAGQRHLVTDPDRSDAAMAALLVGTLSETPPGQEPACMSVPAQGGGRTYVVWPHGYRLSAHGEVLRGDGSVAARVGHDVQIAGGLAVVSGGAVPGDTCPPGDRWSAAP